ncbi:MAG: hypothetical protein U0637_13865 [Phycisphaerales bacterium]
MQTLSQFWLPILASAGLCWIASALLWMVLPVHKNDFKNPGDKENTILDFVRTLGLAPGMYWVPYCDHGADRKNPEKIAKMKTGPFAGLVVMAGVPNMGRSLGLWILNLLLIGFGIAYVAGSAGVKPDSTYWHLFKVVGIMAFMIHAGNALTLSIWMGMPWGQLPGRIIDAVVYGALTAGSFAGFWPKAAAALPAVTG